MKISSKSSIHARTIWNPFWQDMRETMEMKQFAEFSIILDMIMFRHFICSKLISILFIWNIQSEKHGNGNLPNLIEVNFHFWAWFRFRRMCEFNWKLFKMPEVWACQSFEATCCWCAHFCRINIHPIRQCVRIPIQIFQANSINWSLVEFRSIM